MLILHDFLIAIVNGLIHHERKNKKADKAITVPRNLAEPLWISSQELGTKVGMNASIAFMWRPTSQAYLSEGEDFGFGHFDLRCYLTANRYQETLFFGGSVIAAFYLARINRVVFEINDLIESAKVTEGEVIPKLERCAALWRKITQENHKIIEEFDSHYFFFELRPRIGGFIDVTFEGADSGADLVLSSTGGTAGSDPSFQAFEKGFGLQFNGFYKQIQEGLKSGMTNDHRRLLDHLEEHSRVRCYCEGSVGLRQAYNSVLEEYVTFLKVHAQFISRYILANIPVPNP